MYCVTCGREMQKRTRVFKCGVTFSACGCVKCDRVFLCSTPSRQTMDERFELGESHIPWKEFQGKDPSSVVPMGIITAVAEGARMCPRCVPRFCPQCGTPLERVRERHQKGVRRYTYGCPNMRCNSVYTQTRKRYVHMREVGRNWAGRKAQHTREKNLLRRRRARWQSRGSPEGGKMRHIV